MSELTIVVNVKAYLRPGGRHLMPESKQNKTKLT